MDRKTNIVAQTQPSHNLPINRARELSKSSKEAESHYGQFRVWNFWYDVTFLWGHGISMTSSGPEKKFSWKRTYFFF